MDPLLQYTDFGPTSRWKSRLTSKAEWHDQAHTHILWQSFSRVGLDVFCICIDILHVVDLGIVTYFASSILWMLVHFSGVSSGLPAMYRHCLQQAA